MLNRVRMTLASLLLTALCGCVPLHYYNVMGEVEVGATELDGTILFSDALLPGTELDVVELLDVDRDEDIVTYRGAVNVGPVAVELEYAEAEYSGDTTLTQSIDFLGQTFTVNADVETELTGTVAGGKVRFGMLGVGSQDGQAGVVLGGIVGIQYMELSAEVSSTSPVVISEKETERVVFPTVGASLRIDQPIGGSVMAFIEADGSGMHLSQSEAEGTYFDAAARIGLIFSEVFVIGGGYRYRNVDIELDDGVDRDEVDVEITGPFVFGGLRF